MQYGRCVDHGQCITPPRSACIPIALQVNAARRASPRVMLLSHSVFVPVLKAQWWAGWSPAQSGCMAGGDGCAIFTAIHHKRRDDVHQTLTTTSSKKGRYNFYDASCQADPPLLVTGLTEQPTSLPHGGGVLFHRRWEHHDGRQVLRSRRGCGACGRHERQPGPPLRVQARRGQSGQCVDTAYGHHDGGAGGGAHPRGASSRRASTARCWWRRRAPSPSSRRWMPSA